MRLGWALRKVDPAVALVGKGVGGGRSAKGLFDADVDAAAAAVWAADCAVSATP